MRIFLTQDALAQTDHDYARRLRDCPDIAGLMVGEYSLTWSTDVHVIADDPRKAIKHAPEINAGVLESITDAFVGTRHELRLISPYFVPGPGGTAELRKLAQAGADVAVLTNSLAATDVAAVHSGYSRYRKPLLEAGVRLYEMKPAPDDDDDHARMRIGSSKASLHTKAAIVDGQRVFVGSFNLDPRSATLNCEMGAWIDDESLARQMMAMFESGANPLRSFVVVLDDRDSLVWTERLDGQSVSYRHDPHAGWVRRTVTWLMRHLPIESQL